MKHKLLILTGKYPFANGESFLANELKYIPDYFEEVYIYPILVYDRDDRLEWKYKQPARSDIHIIIGNHFRNIGCCIKALFQCLSKQEFWLELSGLVKTRRISAEYIKNLLLFSMRSHYAADIVKERILNEMEQGEDLTIYSYWMDYDAYAAVLITRMAKKNVRKVISRCHRGDLYEYAARGGYLPMRKTIFDTMTTIYSISENGIRYIKSTYPTITRNNLKISRLGTFDHGKGKMLYNKTLRLVSCSWVRPVKRVHLIPEALNMVTSIVEWSHFGTGSEMPRLQKAVEELTNDRIKCNLLGEFRNEDIMQMYSEKGYHVFINVSENEGVPVSVMEAMSFGMIIIATDVGGMSELIEHGKNGFLLEKDFAIKKLAECIDYIAAMSNAQLDEMSKKSREIWMEKYCADTNYSRFYHELIQK